MYKQELLSSSMVILQRQLQMRSQAKPAHLYKSQELIYSSESLGRSKIKNKYRTSGKSKEMTHYLYLPLGSFSVKPKAARVKICIREMLSQSFMIYPETG